MKDYQETQQCTGINVEFSNKSIVPKYHYYAAYPLYLLKNI